MTLLLKKIVNKAFNIIGYNITKKITLRENNDYERLKNSYTADKTTKLHFGCGPRILKDWINIDLVYEPYEKYLQYYKDSHYNENVRGSKDEFYAINFLRNGIPLPDNSVDVIFHEDFFEHLTQKEQIVFLAETLRVLKKGCVHRINTPNLFASMRDNSDFTKGFSGVFTAEWDNWEHFSIISPDILKNMAEIVGYSQSIFNSKNKSTVANSLPLEYRPDENDRKASDSNVFADLVK